MVKPAINHITADDVLCFQEASDAGDQNGTNGFNAYQRIATDRANYPGKGSALGLAYLALKLSGEAGEVAQQVGKAMRDDGYSVPTDRQATATELTPERRIKIIKELGGELWYIAAMASELGVSLSDIAIANLEQLAGRTERGTLQGDGDDR